MTGGIMLTPWYARFGIERPFPWVGIGLGALLGLVLMPLLAWLGFQLIDQDLEGFTP
jgi:hypothetical protein